MVATEQHRHNLLLRLRALALDIAAVEQQGRYISLDTTDALSAFMVHGVLDSARYVELFGNVITKAANAVRKQRCRVAVFGECVDLLLKQGNPEAAVQMEKLGSQLAEDLEAGLRAHFNQCTIRVKRCVALFSAKN